MEGIHENQNLYIRQFTEEKTIHIKVIMDNSLSMDYGTSVKFDLAKALTKGIGYLTLNQGDIFSFIPLIIEHMGNIN